MDDGNNLINKLSGQQQLTKCASENIIFCTFVSVKIFVSQ